MKQILKNDWQNVLQDEFQKPYYLSLRQFLISEYRTKKIYPDMYDIFNALHLTPLEKTKVVILGQDPYHEPQQAHGLSFSVKEGVAIPPSLKNIFQELSQDIPSFHMPTHGCLTHWAEQGVLLLNAVLTVQAHRANSHKGKGWELFTDKILSILNEQTRPIVFILWGNPARAKKIFITNKQHLILESAHPSPLSAFHGFFGSRPFSKTNEFLIKTGQTPIDWQI